MQVLRYFLLPIAILLSPLLVTGQGNTEIGFGILGSSIVVDPIPAGYRNDFEGPITYLGYYLEASSLLSNNEKWKPRAVVRLQTEGSNASGDWPEIRTLSVNAGVTAGYQLTSVISFFAGGFANYQIATRTEILGTDMPAPNNKSPWGARFTGGVRGDFGRWSTEMLIEKSLTTQGGAVILSREGSPSFRPTFSYLNVHLGLKYSLFNALEKT